MLSLELSQKLKATGLVWKPKLGDLFVVDYDNGLGPTPPKVVAGDNWGTPGRENIWLPRLDQLLAEVARRWEGRSFTLNKYPREWSLILFLDGDIPHHFDGNTAEEAAAKALLWQLEQES